MKLRSLVSSITISIILFGGFALFDLRYARDMLSIVNFLSQDEDRESSEVQSGDFTELLIDEETTPSGEGNIGGAGEEEGEIEREELINIEEPEEINDSERRGLIEDREDAYRI